MSRPRSYKTEGIVLKQTPLGEADRILTLCTPELGNVRAVAKGVRRMNSKLGGHLELLNNVSVSLAEGRSLDVVTEAEAVRSFRGLRDDLERLSKALYVAELVDGFSSERSPNREVYTLLIDTLGWMEVAQQPNLLLRHFEIQLLEHSGYRPELYSCVECRSSLDPRDHLFDCSLGGALCPTCRVASSQALIPISLNAMKVLRFLQREGDYARVAGLKVSRGLILEIERLLRAYLRFVGEREMKSADFMNLVSSL